MMGTLPGGFSCPIEALVLPVALWRTTRKEDTIYFWQTSGPTQYVWSRPRNGRFLRVSSASALLLALLGVLGAGFPFFGGVSNMAHGAASTPDPAEANLTQRGATPPPMQSLYAPMPGDWVP